MQNKNSKTVTIFRAGSFLSRMQGPELEDYFAASKKTIGSYWESSFSKKIGTGLSFEEENILLPYVLDLPAEDRGFRQKVTDFYTEISTRIPYNTGLKLEIGLMKDNNKPISLDSKNINNSNLPINTNDYIKYRHALKHPLVAESKEEAEGNPLKEFYIFDSSEVNRKNAKAADTRDTASQIFLAIKNDDIKVDMMLTLLGVDVNLFDGDNAKELKLERLREFVDDSPEEVIDINNNIDLEIHYWIKTLVNNKIIKQISAKYFDAETNRLLGNNLEEMTVFFKDDTNSDVILALKARNQEVVKNRNKLLRKQLN